MQNPICKTRKNNRTIETGDQDVITRPKNLTVPKKQSPGRNRMNDYRLNAGEKLDKGTLIERNLLGCLLNRQGWKILGGQEKIGATTEERSTGKEDEKINGCLHGVDWGGLRNVHSTLTSPRRGDEIWRRLNLPASRCSKNSRKSPLTSS
jgi:hypothetical protein